MAKPSDPLFTVFTATYNRAHTLDRVYRSLLNQTFRDFEWIIIDDGSTDNTGEIVAHWIAELRFPIRYFFQAHGHKKTAHNRAVKEARGILFASLDSDDAFLPTALETYRRHWFEIPEKDREGLAGVSGLNLAPDKTVLGERFPRDSIVSTTLEMHHRYRVRSDKTLCLRSDILRRFPFPENISGHIPESVVWSAIAMEYKMLFINEPIAIVHPTAQSLSRTKTHRTLKENAAGYIL